MASDKPTKFNHPPLNKTVVGSYPTPIVDDVVVVINKEVNINYKVVDYGAAHPDTNKYPNHKLALIQVAEDDIHAKWFYVADRADQDTYNFALKFKLEDHTSSVYIRQYVLLRAGYAPLANGVTDSADPNSKLVHEEVLGAADGELASLYIKVARVFERLPGPSLFTQSNRQGGYDLIPPEFRQNDNYNETDQEVATGTAPDSANGTVLESTVKPKDTVKADKHNKLLLQGFIPILTSKITNRWKQFSTQVKSLISTGGLTSTPSAVQTVTVEDLGNGKSVQIVTTDPLLFTQNRFEASQPDLTPEEFRVNFDDTATATTVAGTAAPPVLDPTSLSESEEQIDTFTKRVTASVRPRPTLPTSLAEKDTNQVKQAVTVTKTLQTTGAPQAVPTSVRDVVVRNIGDGRVLQTTRDIPSVFAANSFSTEQLDLTPEIFRTDLDVTATETTLAGTAAPPSLGTDDLSASEKQIDVFLKRTSRTSRPHPSLPITKTGKETNAAKQVVTVAQKLRNSGSDPLPDALTEVEVKPLGDGRVVEIVKSVPVVFNRNLFGKQRSETVPQEFLWNNQILETSADSPGTAVFPTLGTSDLSASQEQVDAFVVRAKTRSRILPTTAVTLNNQRLVEEYGGGNASITRTLQTAGGNLTTENTDFRVVSAEIKDLGNGKEIKEVVKADAAWPLIVDNVIDRDLDTPMVSTRTVITTGTEVAVQGAFSEVDYKAIDSRRRLQTATGFASQAALDAYSRQWAGTVDVVLPAELISVVASPVVSATGGGNGTTTGSFGLTTVAGRLDAGTKSSSSASLMMGIVHIIKQRSGHNIPCTHVVFLLPNANNINNVRFRLQQLTGIGTINLWPKFSPQSVTLICTGQSVTGRAGANLGGTRGVRQDYNGDTTAIQVATQSSVEVESENSVHSQTHVIEPTIHPALAIGGAITGTANSGAFAATASISGLGSAVTSSTSIAHGSVLGGITATPGSTSVPTTGTYLYRCMGEPYRFGQIKYHAIIIDAANIPG